MPEQGLGVHALTARGPGSIPGWGSKDPDTAKKIKIKKICLKMANSVESAILLPFPDLTTVCSLVFILPNLFYLETYILAFLFFLFVFSCAIIMYIWFCCLFFFFFWSCHVAYGIFVPPPGIELMPPELEVCSLSHQTTREVPITCFLNDRVCWMSFQVSTHMAVSLFLLTI